ncbi:aminotransferase class I/II-fold pyridoxal phosphate-dependent enzyme [Rhodopirellula sp. SWK7]|uniref:aminotransferase class I/II-fold pyridoxal phosphate-dependent enzyme n=1 Tax=Rhodopirellula sp. SWK7 TaxID=595460 RepID=UPI0002BD9EF8|nr:8-amino-7-oxononanoate synthase [Rhodopirellula sp. SWK7]EMI41927.1 8-amino-7-oxononanoate synthase [Rhodopirellula sp. SWK7]
MSDRSPFDDFAASLDQMSSLGRRRRLVVQSVSGPYLVTAQSVRLLNFGGNDYLGVVADGLAHRSSGPTALSVPDSAEEESQGDEGLVACGATASALVCGWTPHHEQLAAAIARAEGTEAAVVFPSGYAACSGAIATLCRQGDLILSDQLNHASLIDGCRASKADREIYPHRDVECVDRILSERRGEFRRVWIVTDGVFSMDGDTAPLHDLVRVARKHDAQILVDEAHGTGVLGPRGGGLCEAMGVQQEIAVRIGTLSKAVGHQGGFVAGPRVVIDYLIQFCRTLIFSTALSPRTAVGAHRVITSMADWTDRREHVANLAVHLRRQIADCLPDEFTAIEPVSELDEGIPIVPIIVGDDARAVEISERLRERGFFVPAIRPPTVPEGTARLRVSLSAAHRLEHVDDLIDAIKSIS